MDCESFGYSPRNFSCYKGGGTIFDGLKAKEMQIGSWEVLLIMGSAGVLFGLFLVTNAFFSFLLLNSLLGFTLILF